ncbi:hypothetical protein [Kangiella sp. TOML190]|nr:hypothetical protein [Kangiella sp. TOML190]
MWMAFGVTSLIFAILFSGIWVLKQSANKFKIPKGVKSQPYDEDEEDQS